MDGIEKADSLWQKGEEWCEKGDEIKSLSGNRTQSRARRRASRTRRLTEVRLVCLSKEDNTVMRSPPSEPFGTGLPARPALSARSSDAPDIGLRSLPRHAHPTATVAAMSYFRIGSRAEPFFKNALMALEKELGPSHMAVGVHLRKLAMYYWDRGMYSKAEKYYKRAIPVYEKNMGGDHLEVAELLDELSELWRAMKRDSDADKLQERVEKIFDKHEE